MKPFAITQLLKNKQAIYESIDKPHTWNRTALEFLLVAVLGAALYGVVIATYAPSWNHVGELAWKMIVLLFGPVAICTPSLYVFGSIRGIRISLSQLVYLLVGALATTGMVLLSVSPISWFFTWTTDSREFISGMNNFMIALGLGFGIFFMAKGFLFVQKEKLGEKRAGADILFLWFVLLLIVVVQMGQKLGPWYPVTILN